MTVFKKNNFLFEDVINLKGIGKKLSQYLKKKKIEKINDLLWNLPYSHTDRGEIIFPAPLRMIFAKEVLPRNKGAQIIFDVKCSNLLNQSIEDNGGIPVMSPTGHFHIKNTFHLKWILDLQHKLLQNLNQKN